MQLGGEEIGISPCRLQGWEVKAWTQEGFQVGAGNLQRESSVKLHPWLREGTLRRPRLPLDPSAG